MSTETLLPIFGGVAHEESASQTIHWTNLDVTVNGKTGTTGAAV